MKCVPYVQHILNYFHCFFTSTIKIAPVQTILYQFKLFCPSSKTNCSKVKIELQHIHCNGSKQQDMGTHGVVQSIQLLSI